jgi:peptidoglycan hydrolase CwlO-like protein
MIEQILNNQRCTYKDNHSEVIDKLIEIQKDIKSLRDEVETWMSEITKLREDVDDVNSRLEEIE